MILLQLANYISIIPLAIILYLTYNVFRYKKYIKVLLCFLLVSFITQILKTLSYPNKWNEYTKRPQKACDCDYISLNGKVGNKCGMPSGHVSTITFFSTYMAYKTKRYEYLFLIPVTIWARFYKNRHNITQMAIGLVIGLLASVILITKKI